MSQLRITTHDTATGPVVAVSGELDYASAPELRERVAGLTLLPGRRLVLDLRGMEFCDSSGITALIAARGRALEAGAEIALAAVPPHTLRVLRLVGLDQVFTIQADAETADHS
ncbi:STAS domain-containing protein [Streptomyces sp. enrichment culture]|uniref:STAS domain-containing protein n=1 Tax=Streptomyces sp. enrichment culture TaxID=1795815 RepID=UPI003F56BAA6